LTNVSPGTNEHEQPGFKRQVAGDFIVALMDANEGPAEEPGPSRRTAGLPDQALVLVAGCDSPAIV